MAKTDYITDDYIRAKTKVTTKEAAAYLGMSWWTLSDLLQQGCTFGTAHLCPGGRWSYVINGERLYKYKHGIDQGFAKEAEVLGQKIDALAAEIRDFNERYRAYAS